MLNDITSGEQLSFPSDYQRGSYGYTAGSPVTIYATPLNQVISKNIITIGYDIRLTVSNGFQIKVLYVDSSDNYTTNTGWVSGAVIIRSGSRFYYGIKRATEISETADIDFFVSQVTYAPKLYEIIESKTNEARIATLFSQVVQYDKNIYDPTKAIKGCRFRQADGGFYTITGFDVYIVAIPDGKTAVVSCLYQGGSTRQYVRSCRYLNVLDGNGNYVYVTNSDTGSSVYTNTSGQTLYAYFTLYNSDNTSITTADYMIQLFPSSTPTSEYITPYVPYGFELLDPIPETVLTEEDFFVDPKPQSYFVNEVTDTVNKILPKTTKPSLVLAFVTDTHDLPNNSTTVRQTEETFANLKAVCDRVPVTGIVHGGDYVRSGWTHTTQAEVDVYINKIRMMMVDNGRKVYAVNGNHDGINGAPPLTTLYDAILSHNEEYVVRSGDDPYFYADDDKTQVRMIFIATPLLNTYGIPTVEYNWLVSTLGSVPAGYNVLIFAHIDPSCSDFTTNKASFCTLLNSWHNHTGAYSSNTGKIIAMVAGHRHFDWTVPSSKSGLDFPVVVCTCSYCGYITPSAAEAAAGAVNVIPRTDGTLSQDSWSVLIYRPDQDKLYLVRFGAGNDREIDLGAWDPTA